MKYSFFIFLFSSVIFAASNKDVEPSFSSGDLCEESRSSYRDFEYPLFFFPENDDPFSSFVRGMFSIVFTFLVCVVIRCLYVHWLDWKQPCLNMERERLELRLYLEEKGRFVGRAKQRVLRRKRPKMEHQMSTHYKVWFTTQFFVVYFVVLMIYPCFYLASSFLSSLFFRAFYYGVFWFF